MSHDRFDVLERFVPLVDAPTPSFDRFLRRRDRKQRRRRISAGVVGVAVFVVGVVLVATVGGVQPSTTPSHPVPSGSTGSTVPSPEDRVGFIGLPPEGAAPSTPEVGELVLQAIGRCAPGGGFCHVWLYADGRLIWIMDGSLPYGANEHTTGLLEQRLTPAGVELVVSEFLSSGACSSPSDSGSVDCFGAPLPDAPFPAITAPGWTDAGWGLRARAWEDVEITPFVPSRFGACVLQDNIVSTDSYTFWRAIHPSPILDVLPPAAADVLRGRDVELPRGGLSDLAMTCFLVTTGQARELGARLDAAGFARDEHQQAYMLGYHLAGPNRLRDAVLWLGPILPHGEWKGDSGFG